MIKIEQNAKLSEVLASAHPFSKYIPNDDIHFIGSGKAGIGLILSYLSKKGLLENKMSPIIVPPWMGTWVYSSMLPFSYPVLSSNNSNIAWCYHQFGFPQNMDKFMNIANDRKLTVIEDCAHSVESYFQERKLGSFGDFSINSYSKFHFCFTLGGVSSRDDDFSKYVRSSIQNSKSKLRFFHSTSKLLNSLSRNQNSSNKLKLIMEMSYAGYYKEPRPSKLGIKIWNKSKNNEINKRRENYSTIWNETQELGLCSDLEQNGIVPYVVPLKIRNQKIQSVVGKLNSLGIQSMVRNFDVNRCLFESNYKPRVIIPVHSGVTKNIMDKIVSTLKEVHN